MSAYSTAVLADAPAGYWRQDDTGTTMADASGNGHNGTYTATVATGTAGLTTESGGKCVDYQNSGYGTVAEAAWLDSTIFSIEAWVQTDRVTGDNPIATHTSWTPGPGSPGRSWHLIIQNGQINFGLRMTDGTYHDHGEGSTLVVGTNYHVVGTWDGTTACVYINGTLNWSSTALSGKTLGTATQPFRVGSSSTDSGAYAPFDGRIDEVAYYPTALSATQLAAHYAAGTASGTPTATGALNPTLTLSGAAAPSVAATGALTATVAFTAAAVPVAVAAAPLTPAIALTASDVAVGEASADTTLTLTLAATATGDTPEAAGDLPLTVLLAAIATPVITADAPLALSITMDSSDTTSTTGDLGLTLDFTAPGVAVTEGTLELFIALDDPGPPLVVGTNLEPGGRDRYGYGVATWEPDPQLPPGLPEWAPGTDTDPDPIVSWTNTGPLPVVNLIAAQAYTSVTVDGTRPVIEGYELTQRRDYLTRILVGGHDVTYWRGVPTPMPSYGLVEPLLYGAGSLDLPQVSAAFERTGHGALSWLRPGATIVIQRVSPTTGRVVATDFRGILLAPDVSGASLKFDFAGDVIGRAGTMDKPQPIFKRRQDLGWFWWDDVTDVHRPFEPAGGPTTGINLYATGGTGLLDHMNNLSAQGTDNDGNQWTCMPGEGGVYRVRRKDTTTIDCTLYLDDARTVPQLRRDPAEEPNRIFATGVTPEGMRVNFGVYPVLADTPAPPFPGVMRRGDTDARTSTGGGITALVARLSSTGYLDVLDRPGGFDADAEDAVMALQDDANLAVTGVVNRATWEALFDVGVTGYSLAGSHIEPAAQRSAVRRYDRSASGSIIGQNPAWDRQRLVVDRTVDFGTGMTKKRMRKWAHGLLAPASDSNWVGTIGLALGGVINGEHNPGDPLPASRVRPARDLRPGMNVWCPLFDGGTLFHISAIDVGSDGSVSLTVDTQARDAMAVWEVIARNRDNRRDPARAWIRNNRSSGQTKDSVTEFSEVGGLISTTPLAGGWTTFPVVAGQEGTIARLRVQLDQPDEFVLVVSGRRIPPSHLRAVIGDPLSHDGAKRWGNAKVQRQLTDDFVLLYVAGDDQSPCGYWPQTKRVKTYTPMVANPHYNTTVPKLIPNPDHHPGDSNPPEKDNPDYDARRTVPQQVPNPSYNPATDSASEATVDKVVHELETPVTGTWQDDAGFGYRTFGGSCVLWVSIWTDPAGPDNNSINAGRIMWPQLEAGS